MKFKKIINTIFLFFILSVSSSGCVDAGWEYVAPMLNQRYGHDTVLGNDGRIYVMGGQVYNYSIPRKYNNGTFSNLVYDPKKDDWKVLEPVPGWIKGPDFFNYYDATKNKWMGIKKQKNQPNYYKITWPMKQKGQLIEITSKKLRNTDLQRQGDGVAIVSGKDGLIYWTGGNGKWGVGYGEKIVLPYDPLKMKWPDTISERIHYSPYSYGDETVHQTNIPPMNEHRIDHEAVVTSDGKIFVMGGRHEKLKKSHRNQYVGTGEIEVLDSIECYDPLKNSWEFRKPMINSRFLFAAVVGPDDKIYIFGGGQRSSRESHSRKVFDTTEVYDPKTDTWSYRAPMPEPRFAHAGVLGADGKIYIMGGSLGQSDSPPVKDVFIYDPVMDTWEKGPSMLLPRSTLAAVATPDGKIYAIGGTDIGAYNLKKTINYFLPDKQKVYDGQVQGTVEVLNINELNQQFPK